MNRYIVKNLVLIGGAFVLTGHLAPRASRGDGDAAA